MLEENPWRQLPEAPPFVLPEDDKVLRRYPKLRENLRLDFLPVPFHGSDRADIPPHAQEHESGGVRSLAAEARVERTGGR